MKEIVIQDFGEFVHNLNIGHKDNYSDILHKISFIQAYSALDNPAPIYEYLINN